MDEYNIKDKEYCDYKHTHTLFLSKIHSKFIYFHQGLTENKDIYFYSSSLLVMWQVVESMIYIEEWIQR
jgi:hypothetical protein